MEVTILKNKKVFEKDWQSLDDIKYTDTGDHLGQLVDCESKPVYFFPHQKSIIEENVSWKDVIDTGSGDDPICAKFKIEETGIKRYVLKMDGKNIIAFDFSDDVSPQTIEGILPPNYYLVGRMFFECIHWTRDYLEYRAKKCLEEVAPDNTESLNFLKGYYRYNQERNNQFVKEHKYAGEILKNADNIKDWEIKYLLSQVKYVYSQYNDDSKPNVDYAKFQEWIQTSSKDRGGSWAKPILEWGEKGHSIANVEFSNYSNFVKSNNSYFKFDNNTQSDIGECLKHLKDARNLVSHNIKSLVEKKCTDLSSTIEYMKRVAAIFGNETLYDSLNKRKIKIEEMCKEINGITKLERI